MSGPITPVPLISATHAALMQGPVSMNVAARGLDNLPTVMRAFGCTLSPDLCVVRLFVYPANNPTLIQHIQENGIIAAVFNRPTSHETIQLKGTDAVIDAITEADRAAMERYRLLITEELRSIGYPPAFSHTLVPPVSDQAVTIRFTPQQAFSQTPGPNAGQKLTA